MFRSLHHDQRDLARRIFDSWEIGWRSLLLRHYVAHLEVEEATVPATTEQLIVLVTHGRARVESGADGRWRPAIYHPGLIAMTAPGRTTRLRWTSVDGMPHRTLQAHLPWAVTTRVVEELWDRDPGTMGLPDALATADPVLEQVLLGLLRAAQAGAPDLYAESAAEYLAVHTLTHHGTFPAPRELTRDDERVRRARAFLRQNLDQPLSLSLIAAEAGLSRYHLLRIFHRDVGETPYRYLTRLRIERAQQELKRTSATVAEIAGRCGFTSRTQFATAFRRETGVTPTAYRRLQKTIHH